MTNDGTSSGPMVAGVFFGFLEGVGVCTLSCKNVG